MLLEEYRKNQGLTYEILAQSIGLSKNMTWRICRGMAPNLTLHNAKLVDQGTNGNVSIDRLLHELEEK